MIWGTFTLGHEVASVGHSQFKAFHQISSILQANDGICAENEIQNGVFMQMVQIIQQAMERTVGNCINILESKSQKVKGKRGRK